MIDRIEQVIKCTEKDYCTEHKLQSLVPTDNSRSPDIDLDTPATAKKPHSQHFTRDS